MQFADLLSRVNYLPPKDVEVLSCAYEAAASAHYDQNRLSGEKFIEHPLSVAGILADLQLDRDTLAAAPRVESAGGAAPTRKRPPPTAGSRRRRRTSARCWSRWRRTFGSC